MRQWIGVSIGPDNGLSPGRRLAIIPSNARILLIRTLETKLQWNLKRNSNILVQENIFEGVVYPGRLRNGGHFVSAAIC